MIAALFLCLQKLSLLFISGLDVKIQAKWNFNLNSKILLLNPATALGYGSMILGHSLPISSPMLLLMLFSLPGVLSLLCQPSHFPSLEGSLKYIIPALCDPLLCGIIVEFEGAWKKMWDRRLGWANFFGDYLNYENKCEVWVQVVQPNIG